MVEAIQNTGEWPPLRDWLVALAGGSLAFPMFTTPPIPRNKDGSLNIVTLEGTVRANVGDWIILGVKNEMYPCKPDVFTAMYEPVEEEEYLEDRPSVQDMEHS